MEFQESSEDVFMMSVQYVHIRLGEDKTCHSRQEDRKGQQALHPEGGCRVGIVVSSKSSWENSKQCLPVGRNYIK